MKLLHKHKSSKEMFSLFNYRSIKFLLLSVQACVLHQDVLVHDDPSKKGTQTW